MGFLSETLIDDILFKAKTSISKVEKMKKWRRLDFKRIIP